MSELITEKLEDYKNLAINLSSNKKQLSKMKIKLKSKINNSLLFNSKEFTKNLELVYKKIVSSYSKNKKYS